MTEIKKRSFLKGVSYRIGAMIITLIVCRIFTGDWWESLEIAGVIMALKSIWYYYHERYWKRIRWGYEIKRKIKN